MFRVIEQCSSRLLYLSNAFLIKNIIPTLFVTKRLQEGSEKVGQKKRFR